MAHPAELTPLARRPIAARYVVRGVAALVFAVSAAATIACSIATTATGAVLCGPLAASTVFARLPGQTWAGAATSFLAMWLVMMIAMMLPALVPALERYRASVDSRDAKRGSALAGLVALGYFGMWTLLGALVFLSGAILAANMSALRETPLAAGLVMIAAGALQFTRWKARHLAECRAAPTAVGPARAGAALRHGLRLGSHCGASCAGPMAVLLLVGMMDLAAMSAVAVATAAERLAPAQLRVAHGVGVVLAGAGMVVVVQTLALA